MMKTAALLGFSITLSCLMGCHAETTLAPNSEPQKAIAHPATNANPDPDNQGCEAIKDPSQAENCRFLKSVAAARKKSHSDPVVKHQPGTVQQP